MEKLTKEELVNSDTFMDDARGFLLDRVGEKAEDLVDKDKVYDKFIKHFRYQNVNEVTAINDLIYAQNADDDRKQSFARLIDAFDKSESPDSAGDYATAVTDYAAGILTAPSTYAGVLTGGGAKVGTMAAQKGVTLGIRQVLKGQASKESRDALIKAGTQGAIRAGALDSAIAATQTVAQEQTRVETGLQEDIRSSNVALSAVVGAVPGGIVGGVQGANRAVTANQAELIRNNTAKFNTNLIVEANTKQTKKIFTDKKTSSTAKEVFSELLSLKESIPEKLERGVELQKALAPDDPLVKTSKGDILVEGAFSINDKYLQNLSAFATEFIKDIPPLEGIEEGAERFTSKLARVFETGQIKVTNKKGKEVIRKFDADYVTKKANEYGLTFDDIGALLAAEFSRAGKTLNVASQLSQAEKKARLESLDAIDRTLAIAESTITNPARAVVEELEQKFGKNKIKKANTVMQNINKGRIGLMTVQLATTTRNFTNGYMRNYIYGFDNLGAGLYNLVAQKLPFVGDASLKGRLIKQGIEPTEEQIKKEAERATKLGVAQLRTAYDSFFLKDLTLGFTHADAKVLSTLMKDPAFGKTELQKSLFMEMGDVANHANIDTGLLRIARNLNKLNTLSDNMFKRAILTRELNKALMAVDGTTLNDVLKAGKFSTISDKLIGEGMEKALDFTYQTGRFKGKEGVFNTAAQAFIDVSQTQLGSTFVPFPRYLVNQFRFAYEHAPILGLFDFGTGILNKSDAADRFGKQMGGLATLGALYAIRDHYGDETTGAFEYKNPFGSGLIDAQASLGPFSVFAAVADFFYRRNNPDKVNAPFELETAVKALGGGQFRPTGLGLVDEFFKEYQQGVDTGENDLAIKRRLTQWAGNYANTFTVGAGFLKDVVATIDPEYRIVADNNDINLIDYFFKQATRSFPTTVEQENKFFGADIGREKFQSPTRTTPLINVNPFMRQITGLTQRQQRNVAEIEFDRLGLKWFEITPKRIKGDPEFTSKAKALMAESVENEITNFILFDEDYNNPQTNNITKKALIKSMVNSARGQARKAVLNPNMYNIEVDGEVDIELRDRLSQARFLALSKDKRVMVADYYRSLTKADGLEQELGDTKDYNAAMYIYKEYFE